MKKPSKSREFATVSSRNVASTKYSDNFEKSRKLYFSALALIAKDKIDQLKQISRMHATDVYWSQLETLLSRHSAQLDTVSQKAAILRNNLNEQQMTKNAEHINRMNKANNELIKLQKQIEKEKSKLNKVDNTISIKQTAEANSKIKTVNMDINQCTSRIQNLKRVTDDLQVRIEQMKYENNERATVLNQKKMDLDAKASYIANQLDDTIHKIQEADNQLKDLEEREKLCHALYESLKQPLPSIQRIFQSV